MAKKTFSVISLGCFRNTCDSELMAGRFKKKGYSFTPKPQGCDTLLINTCGFIDQAKKESIEVIRSAADLKKKNKIKKLIVFGCMVQRYRGELERFFPEVDQWNGVEKLVSSSSPRVNLTPGYLGFLKICDGCLNRCSYCAIPLIKGPLKSKSASAIIQEAKQLQRRGVKELNIIGQDISSWGRDLGPDKNLVGLLRKLLKAAPRIPWIRLMYLHPNHLNDELLDLIAQEERICKYIDLPIQHISDRILKLMNRKTTRKKILGLIDKIRKKVPGCALRTSLIAGFPTETEAEFKQLLDFVKDTRFDRLGAFVYSQEEGTPADLLPGQVHAQTKLRRRRQLMELQFKIAAKINERFLGKRLKVLVESYQKGVYAGRSQYDAYEVDPEVLIKRKDLSIGEFCETEITDVYGYDLVGR